MRVASEHVALRLALPEPSEIGPPLLDEARAPEALRLAPMETNALGPSPWRTSSPPVRGVDSLFFALRRRVEEARTSNVAGDERARLDGQLGAVAAMTARLEALHALEATVTRERGRWLRA